MKLAIIGSGGGACGEYPSAVLYQLDKDGIAPQATVLGGSSVGGLEVLTYAVGLYNGVGAETLKQLWAGITKDEDVFTPGIPNTVMEKLWFFGPYNLTKVVWNFIRNGGIFSTAPLDAICKKVFGKLTTTDIKNKVGVDVFVKAYNLKTEQDDTLQGDLYDMSLATREIEGAFAPHKGYGDGGAADNTPIDIAIQNGCTHVIILYCGPESAPANPVIMNIDSKTPDKTVGGFDVLKDVIDGITNANEEAIWQACQSIPNVKFLHVIPEGDTGSALDFSKRGLWDKGTAMGIKVVQQIKDTNWLS